MLPIKTNESTEIAGMKSRRRTPKLETLEARRLLTRFCGSVSQFTRTTVDDIPDGVDVGDLVAGEFDDSGFEFVVDDVSFTAPSPEIEVSAFNGFGTNTDVFGDTDQPSPGRANLNYTTGFPPVMWWEPQPYATDANQRTIDFSVSIVEPETKCFDLQLAAFEIDSTHAGGVTAADANTITGAIVVRNDGPDPTGQFDVIIYAAEAPGPYGSSTDTFLLGTMVFESLPSGETRELSLEFPDPIYQLDAQFTSGYHISAEARTLEPNVMDLRRGNEFQSISGCNADHLELDILALEALIDAGAAIGEVASTHMAHYLDGSGSPVVWSVDSAVSATVTNLEPFKASRDRAHAYAKLQIKEFSNTIQENGDTLPTELPAVEIPGSEIGRPVFDPLSSGLDLFLGINGTQGSSGVMSDIKLTHNELGGGVTAVEYSATMTITLEDEYAFDPDDARKGFFNDEARHVAMCGMAKYFDVTLDVAVPVSGSFTIGGPAGDIDRDTEVNFRDFLIIARNFGKTNADFEDGDVDADGEVGFNDFLILAENFGRSADC